MEQVFEVPFTDSYIDSITDYGDYGDSSGEIWAQWLPWKRESFLDSYKSIMEELKYTYIMEESYE